MNQSIVVKVEEGGSLKVSNPPEEEFDINQEIRDLKYILFTRIREREAILLEEKRKRKKSNILMPDLYEEEVAPPEEEIFTTPVYEEESSPDHNEEDYLYTS